MAAMRPRADEVGKPPASIVASAPEFYKASNSESAAALLESSLRHPHQLVRVSAASSYVDVAANPAPAIRILEDGMRSKHWLTRDISAYTISHVDPNNAQLAELLRSLRVRTRRKPSRTATIIHGTWASGSTWWQPNGDFWTYLHDNVDASLYGAADRFGWSGGSREPPPPHAPNQLPHPGPQHQLPGRGFSTHHPTSKRAVLATPDVNTNSEN